MTGGWVLEHAHNDWNPVLLLPPTPLRCSGNVLSAGMPPLSHLVYFIAHPCPPTPHNSAGPTMSPCHEAHYDSIPGCHDPLGFFDTILGYFLTRSLEMIPPKCAPDCCHGREASDSGRETEQTSDLSSTVRSHNPASGKLERRGRPGHNTARTRPFVRIFWTDGQVDAAGSADNGPHRQMDNSGPRPFWMIFG